MATTTATFSLSSRDLLTTSPLSISTSKTLLKAGNTVGLDRITTGLVTATTTKSDIVNATAGGDGKANWIYIVNKESDVTKYITVHMKSTELGRLYAGDWMFLPCPFDEADHDIAITSSSGDQEVEFAFIHEGATLTAS